ncbi:hypothetical protein Pmani_022564 [Petrolisthes manimaculis]|uniref:Uncharacterized protein n=1 Tax=Petrolisthes manimaculis TaxID=1843537 RepID=A0AAE1PCW1_9EUCA|nr:hypothetical protein Pmani_022564 [Petrolisthes manimaculis]
MNSLEHRRDVAALVVLKLQDLLCSHHLQATSTTYKQHGLTGTPQGCCSTGGVEAAGPTMQPPPTSNMDSLEHRRDVAALVVLKLQDLLCSHNLQATWTHWNTAGMLQHWTSYAATTPKQHGLIRTPQGCCSTGGVEAAEPPMQPPPTSNMDSLEHRRDVAALVVLKLQDLLCSHHLQATWIH